tara:strand:+ start:848 stop:1327 length:480 start_codon:yes stop_codon:yes gene_type:complete
MKEKVIVLRSMSFWEFLPITLLIRDIIKLCKSKDIRLIIISSQINQAEKIINFFHINKYFGKTPTTFFVSGWVTGDISHMISKQNEVLFEIGCSTWFDIIEAQKTIENADKYLKDLTTIDDINIDSYYDLTEEHGREIFFTKNKKYLSIKNKIMELFKA